jgi:hypothetical protein
MRPLHLPLAVFLICISAFTASSQPQQQRSDPPDVGTGPSSKAPWEMSYETPKSPETTNARGETTTSTTSTTSPHSKTMDEAGSDRRENSKATKGGPEE